MNHWHPLRKPKNVQCLHLMKSKNWRKAACCVASANDYRVISTNFMFNCSKFDEIPRNDEVCVWQMKRCPACQEKEEEEELTGFAIRFIVHLESAHLSHQLGVHFTCSFFRLSWLFIDTYGIWVWIQKRFFSSSFLDLLVMASTMVCLFKAGCAHYHCNYISAL